MGCVLPVFGCRDLTRERPGSLAFRGLGDEFEVEVVEEGRSGACGFDAQRGRFRGGFEILAGEGSEFLAPGTQQISVGEAQGSSVEQDSKIGGVSFEAGGSEVETIGDSRFKAVEGGFHGCADALEHGGLGSFRG